MYGLIYVSLGGTGALESPADCETNITDIFSSPDPCDVLPRRNRRPTPELILEATQNRPVHWPSSYRLFIVLDEWNKIGKPDEKDC
jgi:hypothetical protein